MGLIEEIKTNKILNRIIDINDYNISRLSNNCLMTNINIKNLKIPKGYDYEVKENNNHYEVTLRNNDRTIMIICNKRKISDIDNSKEDIEKIKKYNTNRYNSYIRFLLENGANPKILELPIIKDAIMYIIENSSPKVKMDGRSPISYEKPNKDGTFTIAGRMNSDIVDYKYDMSYCNEDNNYIKLENEIETIYIDSKGKVTDIVKKIECIEVIAGINQDNIPELQFAFYNENDATLGIIFVYKNGTYAFYSPSKEYEDRIIKEVRKITGNYYIVEGITSSNPDTWKTAMEYIRNNNIQIIYQSDIELDEEEIGRNLGM